MYHRPASPAPPSPQTRHLNATMALMNSFGYGIMSILPCRVSYLGVVVMKVGIRARFAQDFRAAGFKKRKRKKKESKRTNFAPGASIEASNTHTYTSRVLYLNAGTLLCVFSRFTDKRAVKFLLFLKWLPAKQCVFDCEEYHAMRQYSFGEPTLHLVFHGGNFFSSILNMGSQHEAHWLSLSCEQVWGCSHGLPGIV